MANKAKTNNHRRNNRQSNGLTGASNGPQVPQTDNSHHSRGASSPDGPRQSDCTWPQSSKLSQDNSVNDNDYHFNTDNYSQLDELFFNFCNKYKIITNKYFDSDILRRLLESILDFEEKFNEKTKDINKYIDITGIEKLKLDIQAKYKAIISDIVQFKLLNINENELIGKKKLNSKKKE
jgi:hypothetical protein